MFTLSFVFLSLVDSEGAEGTFAPLKKQKKTNKHKKINGQEKKENREREERFSLFASNYHKNLQVYLNFPASYIP